MRRVALWLFLLLLAGSGGWIGYSIYQRVAASKTKEQQRERPAVAVEIAPVIQGRIRDIRRLTGTLIAANRADIGPKISGRIAEITVDLGDRVSQGQVIARLDRDELEEDVAEAESNLEVARGNQGRAEAEVEQARREFQRIELLQSRQVASESDLDTARLALSVRDANLRVAKAEVAQRESALRSAEIRLTHSNIKAEWDKGGPSRSVAARYVEEGELVTANENIVSLVDLSVLNVVLYVTERDYPQLRIGQEVEITADSLPAERFVGHVLRLSPRFEEASRQARVEVLVENPEELLKPGMFVGASVLLREHDNATTIPTKAIVRREGRYAVFVINREEQNARLVTIQPGIEEAGFTEVVDPPLTGEVVTLGQNLIEETTPLRFVEQSHQAAPMQKDALTTGTTQRGGA